MEDNGRIGNNMPGMHRLAIYDMDRTVTRHATWTPFLLHCAVRRAPWRLVFLPIVALSMLAYVLRLIDRGKLKDEIAALRRTAGDTAQTTALRQEIVKLADRLMTLAPEREAAE